MASSTNAERFLKITKAVCADHRSTLSADMVNICAFLNVRLTEEYEYRDSKEAIRQGKGKRQSRKEQTTLNANLEMILPAESYSEEDVEDEDENEENDEDTEWEDSVQSDLLLVILCLQNVLKNTHLLFTL